MDVATFELLTSKNCLHASAQLQDAGGALRWMQVSRATEEHVWIAVLWERSLLCLLRWSVGMFLVRIKYIWINHSYKRRDSGTNVAFKQNNLDQDWPAAEGWLCIPAGCSGRSWCWWLEAACERTLIDSWLCSNFLTSSLRPRWSCGKSNDRLI